MRAFEDLERDLPVHCAQAAEVTYRRPVLDVCEETARLAVLRTTAAAVCVATGVHDERIDGDFALRQTDGLVGVHREPLLVGRMCRVEECHNVMGLDPLERHLLVEGREYAGVITRAVRVALLGGGSGVVVWVAGAARRVGLVPGKGSHAGEIGGC